VNLDDVTVTPRQSKKHPRLLLCARCDRHVAVVDETGHIFLDPVWVKVPNTRGQVWRVSPRAREKEIHRRRTGTTTGRTPAGRRDRSPAPLVGPYREYLMICPCGLRQKIVRPDVPSPG
jgi:hypothetical protein